MILIRYYLFFCLSVIVPLSFCGCTVNKPELITYQSQTSQTEPNFCFWSEKPANVWKNLLAMSSTELLHLKQTAKNAFELGWINLALITKHQSNEPEKFLQALNTWQNQYVNHPAHYLISQIETLKHLNQVKKPKHIAILIPQQGRYSKLGHMVREGFLNAYYKNQSGHVNGIVKFYDTAKELEIKKVYDQAWNEGADFIIGPLIKDEVQVLSEKTCPVPTLALNYTSQSMSHHQFYQFGLLPEDEINEIAMNALRTGKMKAILIAAKNSWGERLVRHFTTFWQSNSGSIQDILFYEKEDNLNFSISKLMDSRSSHEASSSQEIPIETSRREDFDVIFLFAMPKEARIIVPLLRYHFASNIPIYATSSIYDNKIEPIQNFDLENVIICSIPAQLNHNKKNAKPEALYALGQDAYLLSQTLEQLKRLPNIPIYGATGALTMNANHEIHRSLPCRKIHKGIL